MSIVGVKITNYRAASRKICKQIGTMLQTNIRVTDLPKIVYKRENEDPLESALMKECALTVEDVLKRRLGYYYNKEDQGKPQVKSIEDRISKLNNQ